MKLHYYLMSMALAATASVSFTACDDDDPVYEPVTVIGTDKTDDNSSIQFTTDELRVKIGPENMANIPVAEATGAIKAYSLNPDIMNVVEVNGVPMIEGLKNGSGEVMVADENEVYKSLEVSVYTTDAIVFAAPSFSCEALVGYPQEITLQVVTLGNDNYTATTDNKNVAFVSATDEGQMTFQVLSEKDPYTVNVTVTDGAKVSGTFQLTVNPILNPFTPEDLETLCNLSSSAIYVNGVHDNHLLNEHEPYYFYGGFATDTNNWVNSNADGMHSFGWQLTAYGGFDTYGGLLIDYPETAKVGEEVQGSWKFSYSYYEWWPTHNYSGTVKVVEDNDQRQVVVFYGINANRPVVDYGYCVYVK